MLVGNMLTRLELIILKLVGCHRDDVLLKEDVGLALTLASPTIGDGDTIGDAILACQRNDVLYVFPHHRIAAGILLLRKFGPMRLLGQDSIGELLHSLLKVRVEYSLLHPQFCGLNEDHPSALAFT